MIAIIKKLYEQVNPQMIQIPQKQVVTKVINPNAPNYNAKLNQTFNAIGKKNLANMQYAGKVPLSQVNPEHQKIIDTKYRELAAQKALAPAGVPAVQPAIQSVVPTAVPVTTVQQTVPTTAVQQATPPEDVSVVQKVGDTVSKGLKTAGETVSSGAKKAMEFAGEHQLASGVAAGALGALGLRRLLRRNKE